MDPVAQLILHQLGPCDLHADLRAQRGHVDAALRQNGFELVHGKMVALDDVVDRLVDVGCGDCHVGLLRFQELHPLSLEFGKHLSTDLVQRFCRRPHTRSSDEKRHALAQIVV